MTELEDKLLVALTEIYDKAIRIDGVFPGHKYVARHLATYIEEWKV